MSTHFHMEQVPNFLASFRTHHHKRRQSSPLCLQLFRQECTRTTNDLKTLTTDFINFIEEMKLAKRTFLVSMDVASLYTNIPQEEGITTVCKAYENFHNNNPPIPTNYIKEMLRLIRKENFFQFNRKNQLKIHGTAMGTKMAVAFANIFMADLETQIRSKSIMKPMIWKRYIDDIFSFWDVSKTGYRQVHQTSKLTPPYHQIYS